jgi:2-amino-4-hydroxy-6-hydroxymethyldihydropteridine diphosphokinase
MICYIGLGSNLDNPISQVQTALETIKADTTLNLLQTSSFYQSKALTLAEGSLPAEGSIPAKDSSLTEGSLQANGSLQAEGSPQNDYINAVAKLDTDLSAEQLLQKLNDIEASQGRVRNEKWAARTLDLDILLYGELEIQTERLVIPHLQINHRNFVIHPLFEIAGDINIPGLGQLGVLAKKMTWDDLQKIDLKAQ